jgi:hypothetical protein
MDANTASEAAYVVQADLVTECRAVRPAAVFAADAEFDVQAAAFMA